MPFSHIEKRIDNVLVSYHTRGEFNGSALVSAGGKVVYKRGFGFANMEWNIPNAPDTKFNLASLTKQFTAALILKLAEKGQLDINDSITDCLPYYRADTGELVTIHHLLSNTSGIPNDDELPGFDENDLRKTYEVQEYVEKFCSGDLKFEPGSRFDYSNSGYCILGAIIEQVTSKSYAQALEDSIFGPLRMRHSGYNSQTEVISRLASGYMVKGGLYQNEPFIDFSSVYAAGGIYSTVEDLYLWDQALYAGKLLQDESIKRMFTAYHGNYGYGWGIVELSLDELVEYGNNPFTFTSREKDPRRRLFITTHQGELFGFHTIITRVPAEKHLVALLSNAGHTELARMTREVLRVLYENR